MEPLPKQGCEPRRDGGSAADQQVSVEPLPKQGCEVVCQVDRRRARHVSVEPLPKQGCENDIENLKKNIGKVSVEPLPKQGCERIYIATDDATEGSQWNPCRSRGASSLCQIIPTNRKVSVEPLPKQGCELITDDFKILEIRLSGTPAEAGVRVDKGNLEDELEESQWNPCRSRGAS